MSGTNVAEDQNKDSVDDDNMFSTDHETKRINKMIEIFSLGAIFLGNLVILLMNYTWNLPILVTLLICCTIFFVASMKSKVVSPIQGYVCLCFFWHIHNFLFYYYKATLSDRPDGQSIGVKGSIVSIIISVLMYAPITLLSVSNITLYVSHRRAEWLYLVLIMTTLVPLSSSNMFTAKSEDTVLRIFGSIIMYLFLSMRFGIIGTPAPPKYGIAVALELVYIFFSEKNVLVVIYFVQMIFIIIVLGREKMARKFLLVRSTIETNQPIEIHERKDTESEQKDKHSGTEANP